VKADTRQQQCRSREIDQQQRAQPVLCEGGADAILERREIVDRPHRLELSDLQADRLRHRRRIALGANEEVRRRPGRAEVPKSVIFRDTVDLYSATLPWYVSPRRVPMVASDVERLRVNLTAMAVAGAAAACRYVVEGTGASGPFGLTSLAVAASAWIGGISAGAVCTLTAVLIARVMLAVSASTAAVYLVEGLALSFVATRLAAAANDRSMQLGTANARILELKANERHLRALDAAFARLEYVAAGHAVVILDCRGRIAEWRGSPARMFETPADQMIGQRASALFASSDPEATLTRLIADASGGQVGRFAGRARRANGAEFEVEIELHEAGDYGREGFAMILRDLTTDQSWRAFAESAAEAQTALRQEADLAQRQLATLQHVTDPALNTLPAFESATTLLERLRDAIDADGVALVRTGAFRRRVVVTTASLEAEGGIGRRQNDARLQNDRILVIQNDSARVVAMSLVNWPKTVTSLIAVPVLCGATLEGTIEVVSRRARRSTDWELALVQVVAARIAGRVQDDSYLDADAVA
jgi:PAS domain S-box-containing protein